VHQLKLRPHRRRVIVHVKRKFSLGGREGGRKREEGEGEGKREKNKINNQIQQPIEVFVPVVAHAHPIATSIIISRIIIVIIIIIIIIIIRQAQAESVLAYHTYRKVSQWWSGVEWVKEVRIESHPGIIIIIMVS